MNERQDFWCWEGVFGPKWKWIWGEKWKVAREGLGVEVGRAEQPLTVGGTNLAGCLLLHIKDNCNRLSSSQRPPWPSCPDQPIWKAKGRLGSCGPCPGPGWNNFLVEEWTNLTTHQPPWLPWSLWSWPERVLKIVMSVQFCTRVVFLSDPGVSGVRSMGPLVSK